MQIKSRSSVILILGVFWGIIGLSMLTGAWQAKTTTEEVVVNSPSDIKGWMTLNDVSGYFKVPVPELIKVFEFPADVKSDEPLKDIARDIGKEVDDLREVLAAHLGVQAVTSDTHGGEAAAPAKEAQDSNVTPQNSEGGSGEEETIKGRMTLKEVEYLTKVPAAYICDQLGIPDTVDRNMALRDLGQQYGFEVDKIREIAAGYKP